MQVLPARIPRIAVTMFVVLGLSILMVSAEIASPSNRSTRAGVYTAAQAQQGKALYNNQCAICHGTSFEGKGQNPPLAGPDFLSNWQDQTLGDLYTMIQTTMPATKPGSLTPKETSQLIAYILQANTFPTGKRPLPSNLHQLTTVHIDAPQAKP